MSGSNCCFWTCIQVSQEAGKNFLLFPSLEEFSTVCCDLQSITVFGIISKAEVDVFPEFSSFFCESMDVGNLISGSSAFSKSSLNLEVHGSHIAEA